MKKRLPWLEGLIYAESIGTKSAVDQMYMHEWAYGDQNFDRGMRDYITHVEANKDVIDNAS